MKNSTSPLSTFRDRVRKMTTKRTFSNLNELHRAYNKRYTSDQVSYNAMRYRAQRTGVGTKVVVA